jgi:hypothetical protein
MLAIWSDLTWEDGIVLAVIVLVAYLLVMWVAALVWAYRDIASRTRDPLTHFMSVALLLVFNLPGLLLYLILRPKETIAERYDRQLEAEALLQELQEQPTCTACRRKINEDFVTCPFCRTALRTPCATCGKALAFGWVVCPYCNAARADAAPRLAEVKTMALPEPAPETPAASSETPPEGRPQRPRRRPSTATFTPPAQPATPNDAAPDATAGG